MIPLVFAAAFLLRLVSLRVSLRHEQGLIAEGARQFGRKNSQLLAAAHIVYYFSALAEAHVRGAVFDGVSAAGTLLLAFAFAVLLYVIRTLGGLWTLKIYIHPQHRLNRSWLFRYVRHSNYFLNIVPELIGVGLLCHAWATMAVGLPLYGVLLAVRIVQEQDAMRHVR